MPLYNDLHMRTLIIQLPSGPPSPTLAYPHAQVMAEPGTRPLKLQWAAAALLPAADRQTETVALVPAAALSWHRVELPAGLHKQAQRVQAALQGLLEDRLLDDPEQVHLALQTDWANTPRPWVAACDRAWLSAHLQALEQAGLPVHRIVPELSPGTTASPVQLTALGDADTGWLWVSHPERGVWGQPWPALRQAGLAAHERLGLSEPERASAALQAALALAERLNSRAPNAMRSIKTLVRQARHTDLDQQLDDEREHFVSNLHHANGGIGIEAFLSKTPPQYL
jgi:general secretion pathway protein L